MLCRKGMRCQFLFSAAASKLVVRKIVVQVAVVGERKETGSLMGLRGAALRKGAVARGAKV